MLYVRIDRQLRNTDLITFFLIVSLLITAYLYLLLLVINVHLNWILKRQERERIYLLSLISLPEKRLRRKLHRRYLCSAKGANLLCSFLLENCSWDSDIALLTILRTGKYYEWMKKALNSRYMMLRILVSTSHGSPSHTQF